MTTPEVYVPRSDARTYRHTLDALAAVCDVRFVSGDGANTSAVLSLDPRAETPTGTGQRGFVVSEGRPTRSPSTRLSFGDDRHLDRRLRTRVVDDASTLTSSVLNDVNGQVALARRGTEPVWARRGGKNGGLVDVVSIPPPALAEGESLRAHFRADRFAALLPLVHFLRSLHPGGWQRPPLRGCVMIDDPNLHRPSYGRLDFERLSSSARDLGYHATIATVPLDSWFVSNQAKQIFNDNHKHLSLCVHGNNHTYAELAQPVTVEQGVRVLSQALRRMDRLGEKLGVRRSNILVPPHGHFGESMMRAASTLGFDAGVLDLASHLDADAVWRTPVVGWNPGFFGAGRFPFLPRFPIESGPGSALIAAYLDQPIIIAGHHDDSMSTIEEMVEWVNSVGEVRWLSPGDLALSNYVSRTDGEALRVRMYSSRVRLDVPAGVTKLEVEYRGPSDEEWDTRQVVLAGESRAPLNGPVTGPIPVDTGSIEIRVRTDPRLDYRDVARPPISLWPVVRRALTETRDRLRLPRLR